MGRLISLFEERVCVYLDSLRSRNWWVVDIGFITKYLLLLLLHRTVLVICFSYPLFIWPCINDVGEIVIASYYLWLVMLLLLSNLFPEARVSATRVCYLLLSLIDDLLHNDDEDVYANVIMSYYSCLFY